MSTIVRGIGTGTASVMLVVVGVAGYLLAPAGVGRLLTLLIIYLGVRAVVAPAPGRTPNTLLLVVGVWAALSAYEFFGLNFLNSWPLLIVLIGVSVIVQSFLARRSARVAGGPS